MEIDILRKRYMTRLITLLVILGGLITTGCGSENEHQVIQPTTDYQQTKQEREHAERAAAVGKERRAKLRSQSNDQ